MIEYKSKRQRYDLIFSQLDAERNSFVPHWKDLSQYILPRRSRFNLSDVNKGDRRNDKIIDNTATLAARTLRSGMMSGITSPARPWFRLTTPDPDMAEFGPVKQWLTKVQDAMISSYIKSNLYQSLLTMYQDLGVFGTTAMLFEESLDGDIFYTEPYPIGSYWLAKDSKGNINTFVREFRMTVRQLIEVFGRKVNGEADWSNFSIQVRNLYEQGMYESWIDVRHMIMPNPNFDPSKPNTRLNKKFMSDYYEIGSGSGGNYSRSKEETTFLRESGYDNFPVLCPRWETSGEDVYGTNCPAMECLGDIKQLQHGEKRIMEAIDKKIRPPMTAPTSMRNQVASILAGDITYIDSQGNQQGFRPAFEVNFSISEMSQKQAEVRARIQRAFYEDLFLMLAESDRRQITAREIMERKEEKLLALGPVLEQLNQGLLDPMTTLAFNVCLSQGLLPPPPEQLQGVELKVEYISIMAQAQKLVGISAIERFTGYAGQVAQFDPSILDKLKTEQIIDVYADITSVPPSILRSDDEVKEIRENRAKQQQAEAQAQQMQNAVQTAQNLSQIKSNDGSNVLDQMLANARAGSVI